MDKAALIEAQEHGDFYFHALSETKKKTFRNVVTHPRTMANSKIHDEIDFSIFQPLRTAARAG